MPNTSVSSLYVNLLIIFYPFDQCRATAKKRVFQLKNEYSGA